MSAPKEAPNVQQHVEGQTSETESLTNGKHSIPRFAGRQAQATGEAGRNAPLGAPALSDGATGGAAALPCLKNNNSNENALSLVKKREKGRILIEHDGGQMWLGAPPKSDLKKAYALEENLKYLVKLYGLERLGFLTLTFKDNVTEFKEAQRRYNSLATRILRQCFVEHVVTVEPQKRGAVHYHLVVVCKSDIRTGFDFETFYDCQKEFKANRNSKRFHQLRAQYAATASPTLRDLWKHLGEAMERYGFGRAELLPIRSNAEGIAKYVSKYLAKGSIYRGQQFKGARMVRYSRGWRRVSQNFAWIDSGLNWRKTIAEVARMLRCKDMDELLEKAGSHWAYKALKHMEEFPDATPLGIAGAIMNAR